MVQRGDTGMDLSYPHAEEIPKGVEGLEIEIMGARMGLPIFKKQEQGSEGSSVNDFSKIEIWD